MPTESLSKTEFERKVSALTRLQQHVAATLRPAVDAFLKFANAYRDLHRRIGPNYERRVALRARLGIDEYQHQRFMAIAAQSKTLTQFQRALPPAVEPLYELARLTKDAAGEKRLRRAVERKELTPTSGIREIRSIRQSTRRKPVVSATAVMPSAVQPTTFEFVVECDRVPRWQEVEQFQQELTELLTKHGLRPASGGFKNEKTVKQSIERHWAQQDNADQPPSLTRPNTDAGLDALRLKYESLRAGYERKVETCVEKAVRRLIHDRYKKKFGKALRSTAGMTFPSQKARFAYAREHVGFGSDEVHGDDWDAGATWVTDPKQLDIMREAAQRGPARLGGSMLEQADTFGFESRELFDCIVAARDSVPEPKGMEKMRQELEAHEKSAEQAYVAEHAEEIEADRAKSSAWAKRRRPMLGSNREDNPND